VQQMMNETPGHETPGHETPGHETPGHETLGANDWPTTDDPYGQEGSVVSEYGLVAVLGATIAALAISWAKGGAIASLLAAVLRTVRGVALG
jgi:hypothetical protein